MKKSHCFPKGGLFPLLIGFSLAGCHGTPGEYPASHGGEGEFQFLMGAPDYCVDHFDFEADTVGNLYDVPGTPGWKGPAIPGPKGAATWQPALLRSNPYEVELYVPDSANPQPWEQAGIFNIRSPSSPSYHTGSAKIIGTSLNNGLLLTHASARFTSVFSRAVRFHFQQAADGITITLGMREVHRETLASLDGNTVDGIHIRVLSPSAYAESIVILTSDAPFDFFELGGTNLGIDDVCFFDDSCFHSPDGTEAASLGAAFVPGMPVIGDAPLEGGVEWRVRLASGAPRRVESVVLHDVLPDPAGDVDLNLRVVRPGVADIVVPATISGTGRQDVVFDLSGSALQIVGGTEYTLEVSAPPGNGVMYQRMAGSTAPRLDPSLKFEVAGPHAADASGSRPLACASLVTSCP